ncbi:MAG: hypothetical protein IJY20_02760 [Clostridia bacterium]|nr:hypothetical protein [Clostridia bacterium]
MRLFCYYAFCSVKNQLRRLFKTWVAVFLLVCLLFGFLVGFGAAFLGDLIDGETPDEEITDELPGDEIEGELPEDEWVEEEWTEEDTRAVMIFVELAIGGVILVIFAWEILSSDKSGSLVFLPADVNLLFPSPMKPQSVLLFRLMTQIGAMLAVGIYMLFQLPNLTENMGLSLGAALLLILAFLLLIIFSKLVHVLLYTLGATHPRVRQYIRPGLIALLVLVAGSFYLSMGEGQDPFTAADAFFNAPLSRLIPIWGWLKGLCMYSIEGNFLGVGLSLAALVAAAVLLIWVIWHLRADFYEDAMAKTAETAELQAAVNEGRTVMATRKKDRSDRLVRDGLRHGFGANVYFFKAMYNRFRFAHFRVLTKTSETYLVVAVGLSLFLRFVLEMPNLTVVMLALSGMVFFRSLGNPLSEDTQRESFYMVPAPAHAKMLWSLLGGVTNCLLDLLPATLLALLISGGSPLEALGFLAVAVSVDWYATNVSAFIDLSLPTSLDKTVKTLIGVMFVYFGLLPDVALMAIGFAFGAVPLFSAVTAVVNVMIGAIVFAFSPLFVEYGRR